MKNMLPNLQIMQACHDVFHAFLSYAALSVYNGGDKFLLPFLWCENHSIFLYMVVEVCILSLRYTSAFERVLTLSAFVAASQIMLSASCCMLHDAATTVHLKMHRVLSFVCASRVMTKVTARQFKY